MTTRLEPSEIRVVARKAFIAGAKWMSEDAAPRLDGKRLILEIPSEEKILLEADEYASMIEATGQ